MNSSNKTSPGMWLVIGTLAAFMVAFFCALGWVVGKFQEVFEGLEANVGLPFAAALIRYLPDWLYGVVGAGLALLLVLRGARGVNRKAMDRTYLSVSAVVVIVIVLHIVALQMPLGLIIEWLRR